MGTAAVAACLTIARTKPARDRTTCGLNFDQPGGPVVAVCGLAGGVGTSTFALALARQAARESSAAVLLVETDSHRPGLSVLAGHETPHSLSALARAVADGSQPTDTFLEFASGLRLIASGPRREESAPTDAIRALLDQARDAHGLVVIDCGVDWAVDHAAVVEATHIVWVVAGTAPGLATAIAVFDGDIAPPASQRHEVLIARAVPAQPATTARRLRRLARRRCTRLVLAAHDPNLAAGDGQPSEGTLRALAAIAPTLRRIDR
jgi:MinD-like ATPase involved in chromosome partitioning or flagellar assembly